MLDLIRLVYVSQAAFPKSSSAGIVEPEVVHILEVARANNEKHGLVGALYFGNGFFLQCLEGEKHIVNALYENLLKDKRHKNIKLLMFQPVERLEFEDWHMKYVIEENEMTNLLAAHGYSEFEPSKFSHATLNSVLSLLQASLEAA